LETNEPYTKGVGTTMRAYRRLKAENRPVGENTTAAWWEFFRPKHLRHDLPDELLKSGLIKLDIGVPLSPTEALRDPYLACWLWEGAERHGYPRITVKDHKDRIYLQPLVYKANMGLAPDLKIGPVTARCGKTLCINPLHLSPGRQKRRWATFKPISGEEAKGGYTLWFNGKHYRLEHHDVDRALLGMVKHNVKRATGRGRPK